MALTYTGKITFSDIVPGLNEAAAKLSESNAKIEQELSNQQKNVSSVQSRVQALQAEAARAEQAAQLASDILTDANAALQQAKDLVGNLSSALAESGIYHYNYVGTVGSMGTEISSGDADTPGLGVGLPDKLNPNEVIAATILIAGGDGGTTATLNRIGSLMGQIGGNATQIQSLYSDIT